MYSNTFLFVVFGFVCLPSLTLAAIDLTCNMTVNSSRIIFDPWEVCISINVSESHVHRISIDQHDRSGSKSSTVLAVCSKLNGYWSMGQKRDGRINVFCPSKSETLVQMCVNVPHGRKTDIGNLSVHIIDETGASKELCSHYLYLEEEVFPKLKSVCIDMEKHTISTDMDLSNISPKDIDAKYMVSAWSGTDFLSEITIEKETISCYHKELKCCIHKVTCPVNKEAYTWKMTRSSGSSDSLNTIIKIKNLNRNTTTQQNVEAKISSSCEDNGLWEAKGAIIICSVIGIFFNFIVLLVLIGVFVCKKRAPSNENSLSESSESEETDGSELLGVGDTRGGNDDNPHQEKDLHQDQSGYPLI